MILHPSVLALVLSSAVTTGLLLYAARWAVAVLRRWDLASGSSLQLELERRTCLVSTIVGYVLGFELVSLFLYVYTADALAPLFTGAMCAAGTLKASPYGYPVLLLKLANFVAAGLWLAMNHLDGAGFDHPLVRPKYAFLLALVPPVMMEAALQVRFFADLRPEVITSCCGSLFAETGSGLGSEVASLPARPTALAFFGVLAAAIVAALWFRRSERGGYLLAALAGLAIPVGLAAVVAVVSPYVYELPTHHCPFCLLQAEYRYVGYPLYGTLLGGGVAGLGIGVVQRYGRAASLAAAAPRFRRRLASLAAALLGTAAAIAAWEIASSQLRL